MSLNTKLDWSIPDNTRQEWNEKYNLTLPDGITFIEVLSMLYTDTLPKKEEKKE